MNKPSRNLLVPEDAEDGKDSLSSARPDGAVGQSVEWAFEPEVGLADAGSDLQWSRNG
jgi:hypothetical protein